MQTKKLIKLKKILKSMQSVVLAFSGGLDSALLLKVSLDTLGRNKVLAVTARSDTFPEREYKCAKKFAEKLHAQFITVLTKEAKNKTFRSNPINRCYYCKKELFSRLISIREKRGYNCVIDGFNYDDKKDLRYGKQAADELGVRSPLAEARMGKKDIRIVSRKLGLSTSEKPPFACLASRFPYYHEITEKLLSKVDKAEDFLYKCGLSQVRVRFHKDMARIEMTEKDIKRILLKDALRKKITRRLKRLGFSYVSLDLEGYRSGSMNEPLKKKGTEKGDRPLFPTFS